MGIVEMARGYSDYAIRMRREFHMHPEPSMKEFETQKRIMAELDSIGIPYVPAGGTGVVATIRGGKPGKTVALRADIDALELAEENDVAYKSTVNGMMHACGHDGHAASLLAAAKILTELSPELVGTVKLIFQPGEENGQGAFAVISSGTLDDVDAFFGLHLWNYIEAGAVSVEAGPRMASAGVFSITIQGKGGHGSMPDQGVDAALVGAATLMNLQSVVSREISPLDPAVLSIGVFRAGTRFNVLAGEAYLEGTTRCFSPIVNSTFKERIQRVVDSTASAYRAEAVLDYKDMVQPTINDPALSEVARRAVEAYVGADRIVTVEKTTGGEDFSHYSSIAPTMFAFVGCKDLKQAETFAHHHPRFDFDEGALTTAICVYAGCAVEYLAS